MKKKLASKSAFFTPRVVISLGFCAISVVVASCVAATVAILLVFLVTSYSVDSALFT